MQAPSKRAPPYCSHRGRWVHTDSDIHFRVRVPPKEAKPKGPSVPMPRTPEPPQHTLARRVSKRHVTLALGEGPAHIRRSGGGEGVGGAGSASVSGTSLGKLGRRGSHQGFCRRGFQPPEGQRSCESVAQEQGSPGLLPSHPATKATGLFREINVGEPLRIMGMLSLPCSGRGVKGPPARQ